MVNWEATVLVAPALASTETTLAGSVPVFEIVRALKVVELVPAIVWFKFPLKVTVWVAGTNVPLFLQLPASLMSAPGA